MPLAPAPIDERTYQQVLDEALARVPVHNPEWTNFNKSDPGVTLLELFAFLAESVIYRANLIPDRNRVKFLSLLGVPLRPAAAARGLVTFANERGPLAPITLDAGTEVRAGKVPFRVEQGLDVLPVEGVVYVKLERPDPTGELRARMEELYASYRQELPAADFRMYDTVPLKDAGPAGVDLGDVIGNAVWVALLYRTVDKAAGGDPRARAREAVAGRTLTLGFVPATDEDSARLGPAAPPDPDRRPLLQVELVTSNGAAGATYLPLDGRFTADVWSEPGVAHVALPAEGQFPKGDELDPLEAGVGDRPPAIADTETAERLVAWLRVRPAGRNGTQLPVEVRFLHVGINAAMVSQRDRVVNEVLPPGTGEPDQTAVLARGPVLPGSVTVRVRPPGAALAETWQPIDDLAAAGPEVPGADPRQPPGAPPPPPAPSKVFAFDPEAKLVRFGSGARGTRPPFGAAMWADYDVTDGPAGNVGPGAIESGPTLPAGVKVTNPVRTWGGAAAETVVEGERQTARFLRHRDRLVTAEDFEEIARRTPGVAVGRVDVLPAYHPDLGPTRAGDAAGAVTLLVIPAYDPNQPDAPVPDRLFLRAVCDYLEPRRLVTTELFLRGPVYKSVWATVGLEIDAGFGPAQVTEDVRRAVRRFLSPLPVTNRAGGCDESQADDGWPLNKPVLGLELAAVANRVPGVRLVTGVRLIEAAGEATDRVDIAGLELPRLVGLSVAVGPAPDPGLLRDGTGPQPEGPQLLPVPAIPDEC